MKKSFSCMFLAMLVGILSLSSIPAAFAGEHGGKEHKGAAMPASTAAPEISGDVDGDGVEEKGTDKNGNGKLDADEVMKPEAAK